MGARFGGYDCLDPWRLWQQCRELSLPTDLWFGKANSFRCPLGESSGQGWILLPRVALDAMGLDTPRDLQFTSQPPGSTVTLKNLYPTRATCITPGGKADPAAAYLVELADRRILLARRPIDKAYNLRQTPGGAYLQPTLDLSRPTPIGLPMLSGVGYEPWTWAGMVADLWAAAGSLGTFPGLPFTPDGTPDSWNFFGGNAWAALTQVLGRLSCAVRWNPLSDTYIIVRVGADDAAEAAAETRWDGARIWDEEFLESDQARLPQYVRVVFQRAPAPTDGSSTVYAVDVVDASPEPGASSGTYAQVLDDEPALVDGTGAVTNAAALATRAAERAADWFRVQKLGRMHRVYSGSLNEPGFVPGSQLGLVLWEDTGGEDQGGGVRTEVLRYPPELPGVTAAAAATSSSSGGNTWISVILAFINVVINITNNVWNIFQTFTWNLYTNWIVNVINTTVIQIIGGPTSVWIFDLPVKFDDWLFAGFADIDRTEQIGVPLDLSAAGRGPVYRIVPASTLDTVSTITPAPVPPGAPAGNGQLALFLNVGPGQLVFTGGGNVLTPGGFALYLQPDGGVWGWYDPVSGNWRLAVEAGGDTTGTPVLVDVTFDSGTCQLTKTFKTITRVNGRIQEIA